MSNDKRPAEAAEGALAGAATAVRAGGNADLIGFGVPDGWHCPAERALDFLAGKWRPMIVFWLLDGPLRFNELQRRLGGVTHRTLSRTLKEMESEGMIVRRDYGEIPPRVDYALTDRARALRPVLEAMEAWARDHAVRGG